MVVKNTDQTNKGTLSKVIPSARILITVEIKLTEPKIDLAPAKWREKIPRSTEGPLCAILDARGG